MNHPKLTQEAYSVIIDTYLFYLIMSALKPGAHEAKKDGNKKELVETG